MTDDEKEVKMKSTTTTGSRKAFAAATVAVLVTAVTFLLVGHYVLPPAWERHCTVPIDCPTNTSAAETASLEGKALTFHPANECARCDDGSCSNHSAVRWENAHEHVDTDVITEAIQDDILGEHIRFLIKEPHVAGSPREEHVLAQYVADRLTEYGFDEVRLQPYYVLLSYPNSSDPNTVQLVNMTTGEVLLEAASQEEPIEGFDSDIEPAFLAYSPPGDVLGCLVYVNRATHEDLDKVEALNVNITGCLCIARHGGSTLASKAYSCARKGAVGLLVFPDPSSRTAQSASPLFPAGPRMPDSVLRRDTMMHVGDPLTPGVPAIPSAERMDPAFASLPPIPSQSISYRDAELLLRTLGGPEAPGHFRLLENVTYRLGDGSQDRLVRLRVNNLFALALIKDVIAKMRGAVEPDRYVVVGAQRDSFGFGALHPAPSTASLLALGQALGSLKRSGLRPRRSVLLCSWAAGEYGQVGSTEWVEEHLFELQSRAFAYIDISECASGGRLVPKAWPTLENLAVEAASRVWEAREANMTVADVWERQETRTNSSSEPNVWPKQMDATSDTVPFSLYAGVPSLSFLFKPDKSKEEDGEPTYPAYHTAYDTFLLYHNWTDSRLTPMCARLHGAAVWLAANAAVVPSNFSALGRRLDESLSVLRSTPTALQLELNGVSLDPLRLAIERFRRVADQWTEYVAQLNQTRTTDLRFLNDQMMLAEQAFLKTTGLPGRPLTRHLLWAPSEFDRHRITGFPVFSDLLFYISQLPVETRDQGWKNVRFYLADVLVALRAAAAALRVPTA